MSWRSAALVGSDSALIVAVAAALLFAMSGTALGRAPALLWQQALLTAIVAQCCLYAADLYDLRIAADAQERCRLAFQAMASAALMLAVIGLVAPQSIGARGAAVATVGLVAIGAGAWRSIFTWLVGRVGRPQRLLIVGTGRAALRLWREVAARDQLGLRVVGFVQPIGAQWLPPLGAPPVLGTTDALPRLLAQTSADRVVVSLTDARGRLPMDHLMALRLSGVVVEDLATVYEECTGKVPIDDLRPSWIVFAPGIGRAPLLRAVKRGLDVVSATAGLLVGLPAFAVIAIATRLSSPGPVLYSQRRVGRHGVPFTLYKFRSMRNDAERGTGAVWAAAGDARVTSLGRWLRRTRADELPQLWNVLRGDMSLIGPRPERPEFVDKLMHEIPFYAHRHTVPPGLTGWAQVRYPYGASVDDAREKLQYDLFYIKNGSLRLDAFILLKTFKVVLLGVGAR